VMTFLIGLSPTDVPQPLAQFQATSRTREDVTKMIADLNKLTATPVKDHILAKQIQAWWPQLDHQLTEIERNAPAGAPPKRSTHDMLEEVLTLLREWSRQPGLFLGPGGLATGVIPFGLNDINSMFRVAPASSSLVRQTLARRLAPFVTRAFKTILDDMGEEAADKVEIYLSPDTRTVFIVSDLLFPAAIFGQLRAGVTELGLNLGFVTTEEFRKARSSVRYMHLPCDASDPGPDLDDE
jgi:hypothetical protein